MRSISCLSLLCLFLLRWVTEDLQPEPRSRSPSWIEKLDRAFIRRGLFCFNAWQVC